MNKKKLSLYPMKFEDALRAILKVPPPPKEEPTQKRAKKEKGHT